MSQRECDDRRRHNCGVANPFRLMLMVLSCSCLQGQSRLAESFLFYHPIANVGRGDVSKSVTSALGPFWSTTLGSRDLVDSTAEELLGILVEREKRRIVSPNNRADRTKGEREKQLIDKYVQALVDAQAAFDPQTCLSGPFFATVYNTGASTPLWEKIGVLGASRNMKGQRYTLVGGSDLPRGKVLNYAEIFGNAFHLRAYGNFTKASDTKELSPQSRTRGILSFFGRTEVPGTERCPVDYDVQVTTASIKLFGSSIDVPISGTGKLRVLFADENMRIFISPTDTSDSRWEKSGLVVIQVRADLIGREAPA